MIKIQLADFDATAEVNGLIAGDHNVGAVVSFIGLVRDMAGGEPVSGINLEHYPGMTERTLAEIEQQARDRWPLSASLIIHRHGDLAAGDRIVLVACASAHRQAAFDACNFLIDWLKTEAPFWKREKFADGDRWVEAKSSDDQAAARWRR